MRKTIVATVIAVAVLATAGTVIAQSTQRFEDVPSDAYFYEAVNWAVDNGITTGCGDGTNFCPDAPLTRAHVVTFLHRALAPEFTASGAGDDINVVVTDDVTLEPGYYAMAVNFELAPHTSWDDPDDYRDFYVWFGSKDAGWELVNMNHNWFPEGLHSVRVDEAGDYWFSIEADDEFVWWIDIYDRPTPEGVTFE